ncbi:acyl-ACP thioesterase [bacterium BMS3Abin05]|nr:acyl-ACP thioesterase [bacterium BMS3Abin05]GBE27171.1 acyl-ACP thioesterase [bacterium BMS3Bbin03]
MTEDIFTNEYPVRSYECGPNRKVTILSILNYMQDTAVQHSRDRGFSIETLIRMGITWVLYRIRLDIHHYPEWNSTVVVNTWPYRLEALYAIREFRLTNPQGQLFAHATTQWVLVDFNKMRPIRIPDEIIKKFPMVQRREIPYEFSHLPKIRDPIMQNTFTVRWNDLDSNKHVNNTKFVEWCAESIPPDEHLKLEMDSLEIAFRKEAHYGEHILSSVERVQNPGNDKTVFLHQIKREHDGIVLAQARTSWRER